MTRGAGAVRRLIEGRLFFFEEIRYVIDIYLAFLFLEDETKQYIYHSFPCFLLYKIVSLSRAPGGGGSTGGYLSETSGICGFHYLKNMKG